MSTVSNPPRHVQASYSTMTGMLIREDGKTRPATLDEVERDHGQGKLDDVMSASGWVDLVTPPTGNVYRCRCWAQRRGDWVVIILPGFGKVQIPVERAANHPPLLAIFNRVLDADNRAGWNVWKKDGSDKAFIELSDEDVAVLAAPMLKPISTAVRKIDLSQFSPTDRPAA